MGLINFTAITDGSTADAADVNTPLSTVYNEFNGNIENANIKSGAAIDGAKLADASITNAKLSTSAGEIGGAWASWTPTWTTLTIGNATVVGKYKQVGKLVFFKLLVTLGNTSSFGSGDTTFSLPVTSTSDYVQFSSIIGQARFTDTGGSPSSYLGHVCWHSTTAAALQSELASSTYVNGNNVDADEPHTWAATDVISAQGFYEAA